MPTTIYNHFMTQGGQPLPLHPDGLVIAGAYFPIEIHPPQALADTLTQSGQPLPPAQVGLAIIDTGATMTAVHEPSLVALGLQPVNTVQMGTANGQVTQNVYAARIFFPTTGWNLELQQVVGSNLAGQIIPLNPPQPMICLLGRNTLRGWVLTWNGPGGFWTVSVAL
ncbi:MAG: retropepsin-like aspartic protease [Tepidiformaceae bacterium]|jgi:predicted aspartyl protease